MAGRLERLDHVALWVAGRDSLAARLQGLGLREIERTDRFTLLGGDARSGKLTLFDAEGPREAGVLGWIGLRLPGGSDDDMDVGEGLVLRLLPGDEIDLDHVALRVPDPEASARRWVEYGLRPAPPTDEGILRVELGGAFLELHRGDPPDTELPLLNHLGALVASAEELRTYAEETGIEVVNVVDAPNTLAVFVRGPDGVTLEYIEHKPSFSLV
jgi:catechol 2,3-dioxygenase-like lactoylglutathione lyase family enzyme